MNNTEKYLCVLIVSLAIAIAALSGCGSSNEGQLCRRFPDMQVFAVEDFGMGCPGDSVPVDPTDDPAPIDEPYLTPDAGQHSSPPANEEAPPEVTTPPAEENPQVADECDGNKGKHNGEESGKGTGNGDPKNNPCNATDQE